MEKDLLGRLEKAGLAERLPTTQEEADAVEKLLEDELAELSLMERDKVTFDVHGIAGSEIEETPELVSRCLNDLEKAIRQTKNRSSYEKAKYMNPDFVNGQTFRLMFLRSENFNCHDAAERLVYHFEKKEALFGSGEVLGRDVRLSDLTDDDVQAIESGLLQVLPTRDIAGRLIFCAILHFLKESYGGKSLERTVWYVMERSLRDEETQKKGCIIVFYDVGEGGARANLSLLKRIRGVPQAMPKRVLGFHYCYQNKLVRPFVSAFRFVLDKRARTRFRQHFGNHETAKFQLQTYGIPIDANSPLRDENGTFSLHWHQEWLRLQRSQEAKFDKKELESEENSSNIIIPRRFDVLFGRGKETRQHPGNMRALHLVSTFQSQYDGSNKAKKTEIAERIVGIIRESQGRFLKMQETGWVEVDRTVAREKISHFFRHQRTKTGTTVAHEGPPKAKRMSPYPGF